MLLRKALKLDEVQLKADDSGAFEGYASRFGGVDLGGDTIVKGAYASTLRTHGKPKMFFNHRSDQLPIGKWTKAAEDDSGLYVAGELTPGNPQSDATRAAMKHGTVDGLSIGYLLKRGDFDETESGRVIRRIERLVEVSVVTFPMDEAARVDLASVKSEELSAIETPGDFERFLRDAGGLSRALSKAVTARARAVFEAREATPDTSGQEAKKQLAEMVERLSSHRLLKI